MRRDVQRDILDTARELFNQRGYNGVSLQDIASAVGISKGNLTYHFRKKERIIEALLAESEDTQPPGVPQSLEELDQVFADIQQTVNRSLFFFLSHAQLGQISPEIAQKQKNRYREIVQKLENALHALRQAGMVREESFSGEYRHTAGVLYASSAYWAPFSQLRKAAGGEDVTFRRHAWRCVAPLLTEQGRKALEKLISL